MWMECIEWPKNNPTIRGPTGIFSVSGTVRVIRIIATVFDVIIAVFSCLYFCLLFICVCHCRYFRTCRALVRGIAESLCLAHLPLQYIWCRESLSVVGDQTIDASSKHGFFHVYRKHLNTENASSRAAKCPQAVPARCILTRKTRAAQYSCSLGNGDVAQCFDCCNSKVI